MPLAFIEMPGGLELLVILLVGLLVFGGRLPEVARQVGKSLYQFKSGLQDFKNEIGVDAELTAADQRRALPEQKAATPEAPDQAPPAHPDPEPHPDA